MSLLDALQTKPEPKNKVAAILLKLSPEEKAALETALKSPEWTHERLAAVLTASGHEVSESSVRRYRKAVLGWSFISE